VTIPVLPYSAAPAAARPGQFQPASTGYGSAYAGNATEWTVGYAAIGMSHLATEYVLIPVSATRSGRAYNPTADVVQFAFMPTPTQVPGSSDWVTGAWDTDTASVIYPYSAKCLVGPAGTITLGIGTYIIYVKITDNPEIPVLVPGQLQIS
jgi:hypothetical protein